MELQEKNLFIAKGLIHVEELLDLTNDPSPLLNYYRTGSHNLCNYTFVYNHRSQISQVILSPTTLELLDQD